MSQQDTSILLAELERMRKENEVLKAQNEGLKKKKGFELKVSDKGCLSIYGFGRFPISMYKDAMEEILERKDEIIAFMEANKDKLATKKKN